MNTQTLLIACLSLSIAAIGLVLFLTWKIQSLLKLKNTFFAGGKAASYEELLHSIARHINELENIQDIANSHIETLEHNTGFAMQKMGIVRFNPFDDGGGNFSFCVALLDAHDSGFVITSMHGREQNRIYSKRLEKGVSEIQLTEEEVNAVDMAKESYGKSIISKPRTKNLKK